MNDKRIHVRPLRDNVPAENGARTFLPRHGLVRHPGAFWDRMQQIGAVEVRKLPPRGTRTMVRPVAGARVLASGHRAPAQAEQVIPEDGAEVEWGEPHESALSDNLIEFVPPPDEEAGEGQATEPSPAVLLPGGAVASPAAGLPAADPVTEPSTAPADPAAAEETHG